MNTTTRGPETNERLHHGPWRWKSLILPAGALLLLIGLLESCNSATADEGPNGGDVVALDDGKTKAELLANSETGEVMVHTWDADLEKPLPLEAKPLTLGSGDERVALQPHPMATDPEGYCSRFYGQADWMRGGKMHHGWLRSSGDDGGNQHFDWDRCWSGGEKSHKMWGGMREHSKGGKHHGGRGANH